MSAITVSQADLKSLIQSAVDEAFERHATTMREELEQEEIIDHNLGLLVEESRGAHEPTMPGDEFLARLKQRL